MPPDTPISMRRTKLKAEEAALLTGELHKPTWESRNEGIHERVSFEDTIWGFDLAGGAYYKTPLRVTYVKPDSRAEKAGIRPGDSLLRINDVDTSTLTIQEAHEIILESGIHLKLAVTAPEDEEDAYFCYEDPVEADYDSEEERRKEEEKARKREVHARVSSYWSLQWPWVSKRKVIYRESNCFMVPSKFENKHKDKFPAQPFHRLQDDIVLHSAKSEKERKNKDEIKKNPTEDKKIRNRIDNSNNQINGHDSALKINEVSGNLEKINETEEDIQETVESLSTYNDSNNDNINSNGNTLEENGINDDVEYTSENEKDVSEYSETTQSNDDNSNQNKINNHIDKGSMANGRNEEENMHDSEADESSKDNDMINELLEEVDENVTRDDEENINNGILSDSEEHEPKSDER